MGYTRQSSNEFDSALIGTIFALSNQLKRTIMWIVFAVFFMLFLMSGDNNQGNVSAQC